MLKSLLRPKAKVEVHIQKAAIVAVIASLVSLLLFALVIVK